MVRWLHKNIDHRFFSTGIQKVKEAQEKIWAQLPERPTSDIRSRGRCQESQLSLESGSPNRVHFSCTGGVGVWGSCALLLSWSSSRERGGSRFPFQCHVKERPEAPFSWLNVPSTSLWWGPPSDGPCMCLLWWAWVPAEVGTCDGPQWKGWRSIIQVFDSDLESQFLALSGPVSWQTYPKANPGSSSCRERIDQHEAAVARMFERLKFGTWIPSAVFSLKHHFPQEPSLFSNRAFWFPVPSDPGDNVLHTKFKKDY